MQRNKQHHGKYYSKTSISMVPLQDFNHRRKEICPGLHAAVKITIFAKHWKNRRVDVNLSKRASTRSAISAKTAKNCDYCKICEKLEKSSS